MKPLFFATILFVLSLFGLAETSLRGQVVIDNNLVVLLTEDFSGGLGNDPGQVRWEGSGGFAAVGGDRVVQIGGSPNEISWIAPNFIGNGNTLILGDPSADGTLIWDKAIFLGANRRIRVLHGIGNTTRADARIDRALRGSRLTLEGDGRLDITADNPNLRGFFTVLGAELRLNNNGKLNSLARMEVQMGGAFTLDNAGTSNAITGGQYISDRFTKTIRLISGTFRYIGQASDGDSVGALDRILLDEGANTIDIINNKTGFFTEVSAGGLTVFFGAAVNFISSSGVSDFGDGARLKLSTFPILTNEILPYATVNGADWATGNENFVISYGGYYTGA